MRSRRERPAKPALTRDGIVTTALSLLRSEGLTFAETSLAGTVEARRLLRMEPEAMLDLLRREQPRDGL